MSKNDINQYDDAFYEDEEYDEIDIMELVRKVLREWKLVLKWCGVAVLVGLVVAFSIPKEYSSSALMASEKQGAASGGGLSSLASLAGINLGGITSGSDAFYPDLYPDVVSSTPFVVDLFSVPVEFKYKGETMSSDLYTYLKEYTKSPWWNAVMQLPFKVLGWGIGLIRGEEEDVEGYAELNPKELTLEQEKIAKAIREIVTVSVDKKTSMITIATMTQDPHVAATVTEVVMERLQEFIASYRTDKSRHDLEYFQQLYDESKEEYYAAQQRYARYSDANQGVVLQSVRTESERLQNEMNLAYQLYNSCAQQLQVAKATVQKETPVCTVLEPPTVPTKRAKPSKVTILFVFIFLGGACAVAWVLWVRDWFAPKKEEEQADADPSSKLPSKE